MKKDHPAGDSNDKLEVFGMSLWTILRELKNRQEVFGPKIGETNEQNGSRKLLWAKTVNEWINLG